MSAFREQEGEKERYHVTTATTIPDRGADRLSEAKKLILQQRDEFLGRAAEFNALLDYMNVLESGSTRSHELTLLPLVEKDEYKGVQLSPAVEDYLPKRKGHRIPFLRVVADMLLGGVDPGKRQHQSDPTKLMAHKLKHMMGRRRDLIAWEPDIGPLRTITAERLIIWLAEEPQKNTTVRR